MRWAVLLLALAATALLALPALGAGTKDLTVVPAGSASGDGLTDLRTLTYAKARDRLQQLSSITLPVAIPGIEQLGASNVDVDADDAGRSLALTGSATLYGHDVDLLVTAIWPDDDSTQPKLAIAAKAKDISLSAIDPRWDGSYGDARFAAARVAVSSADQEIDPAALPASARGFFPEPVELTGGVSFAGSLQLTGRLADAFGYAGHSGDVELDGSVGTSAAALFGHGGADLRLKATLGKSPDAPAWLAGRTSTYELAIAGGKPSVTVDEHVTLAVDGTTNTFTGHLAVASTGAIEGELGLDGALDAPFGLDGSKLSDVALRLARGENGFAGGLGFTADDVRVDAGFVTEGGSTRADFTIDGALTVPKLVALGSDLLGTPVTAVPGADDVSLDHVSFSFAEDVFSVAAKAKVKGLQAGALLTLRAGKQPLLGLRLSDPDGTLAGVRLPAVDLTATSLTELAKDDLTPQEEEYFGAVLPEQPDTLSFTPGVNLEGRLPLDSFGYGPGAEATLSGTLGGLDGSLKGVSLAASLPAPPVKLPGWVIPTGPTTLAFKYAGGSVNASFATAAKVQLGGASISTSIGGAVERSGDRTTIHFTGALAGWKQPFGLAWIPTLNAAKVQLDTSFGGGRPATVDASAGGSVSFSGHTVGVDFALSTTSGRRASVTATLDHASVGELAAGFKLGDVQAALPTNELRDLSVDDVRASVTVGDGTSFALTGTASLKGISSDVLVAVRPGGGFTLGVKTRKPIELGQLAPTPGPVTLPAAAVVLSNAGGRFKAADLSDQEFDFYKPLYGCSATATRTGCAEFQTINLSSGLKLIAGFDMGPKLDQAAERLGLQTHGLIEGTIPVLGGRDFSLRAELGGLKFPVGQDGVEQRPDWFDHGSAALTIGREGVAFEAGLGVRIRRDGQQWMPACDGGRVIGGACYDVLDFKLAAAVRYSPLSFTLTGGLVADGTWRNAFGQSWLAIKAVKLQLGVTLAPGGPQVTMGFLGDVTIGSKDVAAALKVGLAPLTAPPFVRVDLVGFSFASQAGLSLSDLLWLNEQITHTHLDASALPDVSLRNLYVQFSQQTDTDLCLTQGLRFNADLYAGKSLQESPAITDDDRDAATGCRKLDTDPQARQSCLDRRAEGCVASVYGRFDAGGLVAGGEINAFQLGPISLDDSSLALALTPARQQLSLHGGVRIGSDSYEVARGRADLDISKDRLTFAGDASLFNKSFEGYLRADAAFDLDHPSFAVQGWLRENGRSAIAADVEPKVQVVRPVVVALSGLAQLLGGNGSVANISNLPATLTNAGVPVPDDVNTMAGVLGDMQTKLHDYGRSTAVSLDQLLKGVSFGIPGIPGAWSPNCVGILDDQGRCWGWWDTPKCIGTTVIDGKCWATPPATISIPGICDRLSVPSTNCSWAGLVRTYVRPALIGALEKAIHVDIDDGSFETALNRLANGVSSLVNVDCAYFSADGSALAQGRLTVELRAKLKLFGQPVGFGGRWDFAAGDSPDDILKSLIASLLSPAPVSSDCPAFPAGHEQVSGPAGAQLSSVTLTPAEFDEGSQTTLRATFADPKVSYPGLKVEWGDGATTTLPAGESGVVSATHAYGRSGQFLVRVWVLDQGGMVKRAVATVRNVAPAVVPFELDPLPAGEDGTVTLRGALVDPGADRETVSVSWGDGSASDVQALDAGTRRFTLAHRYADDGTYPVTVTATDEDGGTDTRKQTALVLNVAPFALSLKPVGGVTAGRPASFAVDFADPGRLDQHKVTLDWGDGSPVQVLAVPVGKRHLEIPHTYTQAGTVPVKVKVTDEDGARVETIVPIQALSAG